MTTLADFTATALSGTEQDLGEHLGSVVLVVNTASKCGLTPQYEGLQALHERFADRGLTVLGFPCDQFNNQEPGTDDEISEFCQVNYGVTFPMFSKIEVNGEGEHEVEGGLKIPAGDIEWNFGKFLLDRDGQVLRRWSPQTTPEEIADDIEAALGA
ncbi:glutathione peroxidase [Brachybacterium sp. HMSC06H03]|uniref:glutathione peroxidase n=1 Tax=Brachybacterium sp. HMSC06H03 TaxID=1581127 RepID=UPI0008A37DCA|nr:glutathione peroxidase [Brachybacterium sp. HMSC06H03]OFT63631.1 glutathione peroxidase [Brachybacterium sp. HMSC06H03]